MARLFRHQADEEILDRAAALFAQHGFAQTSLRALADAVGLSKAGLLHHYPSKDALYEAAVSQSGEHCRGIRDQVSQWPPGPARDRRALELLIDDALDRPGLVALALSSVTSTPEAQASAFDDDGLGVFAMFGVDPGSSDPDRVIRVIGALGALAVLTIAANHVGDRTSWRPRIVATCFNALGHDSPRVTD